jgi:hypothetical protein
LEKTLVKMLVVLSLKWLGSINWASDAGKMHLRVAFYKIFLVPRRVGIFVARYYITYRGLARDVINDVTDSRRHIGGIFCTARDVLMEITLENGRK